MLLWQEYKARHPDGCQYSAFCDEYEALAGPAGRRDALRARAGREAVRRLRGAHDEHRRPRTAARCRPRRSSSPRCGASNFTYVEASLTQTRRRLAGRARARTRVLRRRAAGDRARQLEERRQHAPAATSPSSTRATRTWPSTTASRSCRRGCASRATRPRSKSAVQGVERWILAPLRHCTFFSLGELNAALRAAARALQRPAALTRARARGASRFLELDRPALKPLPAQRYQYATWKKAKVHLDYHVEVERRVLLGAVPADRQDRRCAPHRAHGRGVLPRPGGRHAPAPGRRAPLHHRPGASTRAPSRRHRAEPRAAARTRRGDRPGDRRRAARAGATGARTRTRRCAPH